MIPRKGNQTKNRFDDEDKNENPVQKLQQDTNFNITVNPPSAASGTNTNQVIDDGVHDPQNYHKIIQVRVDNRSQNPSIYYGTSKPYKHLQLYKCFYFDNVKYTSNQYNSKLSNEQQLRLILSKYKHQKRYELLQKETGLTKEQISSLRIELLLYQQFTKPTNDLQYWKRPDLYYSTVDLSNSSVFEFDMHYQVYPGEVRQILIRFLIRFNSQFRLDQNKHPVSYHGPQYIKIIPGKGNQIIKNRSIKVLSEERYQTLQRYQMCLGIQQIQNNQEFNEGAFFIRPKQ